MVAPAGYQGTPIWCDAKELTRLCDAWEHPRSAPPALVEIPDDHEAMDIWLQLGGTLAGHPAVLLRTARAALDTLADSDALTTEEYEDMAQRIGEAERALAEGAAG